MRFPQTPFQAHNMRGNAHEGGRIQHATAVLSHCDIWQWSIYPHQTKPNWAREVGVPAVDPFGDQRITSSDLLLRDCGGLWLMRAEHGGHMQYSLTFLLLVVGSTAQADPGHLAGLAGHDHWVGGAAIGLAILAGLYGALKG